MGVHDLNCGCHDCHYDCHQCEIQRALLSNAIELADTPPEFQERIRELEDEVKSYRATYIPSERISRIEDLEARLKTADETEDRMEARYHDLAARLKALQTIKDNETDRADRAQARLKAAVEEKRVALGAMICPECGRRVAVNRTGLFRKHPQGEGDKRCPGSGTDAG